MPVFYVQLYIYQLCRVLNYIHRVVGICHRDIKPQNLLVNPHTHQLKICDFGSAKVLLLLTSFRPSTSCFRRCRLPFTCPLLLVPPLLLFPPTKTRALYSLQPITFHQKRLPPNRSNLPPPPYTNPLALLPGEEIR
ncbi:hypothetical protein ABFS82_04G119600 [Erythranthe guttata]